VVPVSGKIAYRDQPLIGGTITFHPIDADHGRPATAKIAADGTFTAATLQNALGLVPGEYRISVLYFERPPIEVSPSQASDAKIKIPVRYSNAETSGLAVSVPTGSSGIPLNLELTD
jgi:hypothetical protein